MHEDRQIEGIAMRDDIRARRLAASGNGSRQRMAAGQVIRAVLGVIAALAIIYLGFALLSRPAAPTDYASQQYVPASASLSEAGSSEPESVGGLTVEQAAAAVNVLIHECAAQDTASPFSDTWRMSCPFDYKVPDGLGPVTWSVPDVTPSDCPWQDTGWPGSTVVHAGYRCVLSGTPTMTFDANGLKLWTVFSPVLVTGTSALVDLSLTS